MPRRSAAVMTNLKMLMFRLMKAIGRQSVYAESLPMMAPVVRFEMICAEKKRCYLRQFSYLTHQRLVFNPLDGKSKLMMRIRTHIKLVYQINKLYQGNHRLLLLIGCDMKRLQALHDF